MDQEAYESARDAITLAFGQISALPHTDTALDIEDGSGLLMRGGEALAHTQYHLAQARELLDAYADAHGIVR